MATDTSGRGADPWPASIAGLGAGARREHAQLQLPAHARNKTRGGLRRGRHGAAVVAGGTDAVTETNATASAMHLPAMSWATSWSFLKTCRHSGLLLRPLAAADTVERRPGVCNKCLIGFFVALSGSVCVFALAVVGGLGLSGTLAPAFTNGSSL